MQLFYDTKGQYWVNTAPRSYNALEKSDVKVHAVREGSEIPCEKGLTPFESLFWRAQTQSCVVYAGPLAGHRAGLITRPSGERILVTSECNAFDRKPTAKPFRFIEGFIDALFVDGHDHVLSWLAHSVQSLLAGDFSPGQMLALAGPPACGKSFFHYLVTQLLGGRMAKPYSYLTGRTAFNGDLARAEHLVIEDEVASADIRARRNFGSGLKQFTVGEELHVHDKGKLAFTAPTFKRVTLSVNDEPENLMILPPFDASITDKVMLLRCKDAKAALHEDRQANKAEVAKELSGFTGYLLKHKTPKAIRCPRFGVQAFHNQDLLQLVAEVQPEQRLLSLIEEVFKDDWRGTATELEMKLRNSPFAPVATSLFYYPTACGVFLSRLASKHPDRFKSVKNRGRTEWEIRVVQSI